MKQPVRETPCETICETTCETACETTREITCETTCETACETTRETTLWNDLWNSLWNGFCNWSSFWHFAWIRPKRFSLKRSQVGQERNLDFIRDNVNYNYKIIPARILQYEDWADKIATNYHKATVRSRAWSSDNYYQSGPLLNLKIDEVRSTVELEDRWSQVHCWTWRQLEAEHQSINSVWESSHWPDGNTLK